MQKYTSMFMSVIIQTCFAHPIIELPDFHDGGWETVPTYYAMSITPATVPAPAPTTTAPFPTPVIFTGIIPTLNPLYPSVRTTIFIAIFRDIFIVTTFIVTTFIATTRKSCRQFFSPQWFPPSLPPTTG